MVESWLLGRVHSSSYTSRDVSTWLRKEKTKSKSTVAGVLGGTLLPPGTFLQAASSLAPCQQSSVPEKQSGWLTAVTAAL